jgi:PAS domain S-box-containing protein
VALRQFAELTSAGFARLRGVGAEHARHSRLRRAFQKMHAAVFTLDPDGRLDFHNPALERLLGGGASSLMPGAPAQEFLPPPILNEVRGLAAKVVPDGGEHRAEAEFESPNLGTVSLDIRVSRLGASGADDSGILVSLQEFSAGRVEARARQLDEAKTSFLSLVSHELRTPLTAMKGSVHLLRESSAKYGLDTTPELVRVLEKNTERLVRLVGNLLDYVHLNNDSMAINRQMHNLREIVESALASCADDAAARQLRFETRLMDLQASVDRERIGQALDNVLVNAIRFSREGSEIRVSMEHCGGAALLRVSDSTEGLAAQARKRLFANGSSARSLIETCTVDGSGIGMAISQSLVELHGGALYAQEQASGAGVDFVIELPVADPGY